MPFPVALGPDFPAVRFDQIFALSFPHKFRHGNAVYSLKMAKDIQALKAVSQNLMHSNISITDGVYGILSDNDVKGQISMLGQSMVSKGERDIEELKIMARKLLDKLDSNSDVLT